MTNSRVKRLLLYSLNRPLSLVAVGLMIIGAGLGSVVFGLALWMVGAWVLACAGLFVASVLDTLSDPEKEHDAALADIDLDQLHDRIMRDKVNQAMSYLKSARKLISEAKAGQLDSAAAELPDMEAATRSIFHVAGRLERYGGDKILRNDLSTLKAKNNTLTESQKGYLETLTKLDRLMNEAANQIDSALAEMGQSYASMQAILVKPEFFGAHAQSFDRVREVTRRLDDISTSFDEVYHNRTVAKG